MDVTKFLIYLEADFRSVDNGVLTAAQIADLRRRVSWNICLRDEARVDYGIPELCWYERDRLLEQSYTQLIEVFNLKHGVWYIRVLKDILGM
ncbi:hypothetical protein CYMTET_31053, partial [Cymbomonas tetramitiformis]